MAYKVRAGKRFKYNLQAVLNVREIKEKKEQEKFAEKQRAYYKEKKKQEEIEETKFTRENELRKILRGPTNVSEIKRRKDHLTALKEDLEKQIEKVIEASRILEEQREKLIEAMKQKKIMETDKDHKKEEYNHLMNQLEMKFLDEIATQRYVRVKQLEQMEES